MTEMLVLIPLFLMLAAGAMAIVYMAWQGLKVQQAANLAARMHGQERIGGGRTVQDIERDNGYSSFQQSGDRDPTSYVEIMNAQNGLTPSQREEQLKALQHKPSQTGSVFEKYYSTVRKLFGRGEQDSLFILKPKDGIKSSELKVFRVITPPEIFNLKMSAVTLEGKAYGGEDTAMYGLVRWGRTTQGATGNNSEFWKNELENPGND